MDHFRRFTAIYLVLPARATAILQIPPALSPTPAAICMSRIPEAATGTNNRIEKFVGTQTATIGGTAKTGGTLTLIFTSASLAGSPVNISIVSTTSTTTDATNLKSGINGNTTLTGAGITATSSAAIITIIIPPAMGSITSSSVTHGSGGTETITLGATALGYSAKFGSYGTTAGTFHFPMGIAIDTQATCNTAATPCLWITDTGNNKIQACSSNMTGGTTYCAIYGTGTFNGHALSSPLGIAVDSSNNVYVADAGNNRVIAFTSAGAAYNAFGGVNWLGSAGYTNGNFESPAGIAIDGSNNIWVTDSLNNRVQEFTSASGYSWALTIGGGGICATGGTCTLSAANPATTTGAPSSPSTTVVNCNSTSGCAPMLGVSYFNNPKPALPILPLPAISMSWMTITAECRYFLPRVPTSTHSVPTGPRRVPLISRETTAAHDGKPNEAAAFFPRDSPGLYPP